MNYAGGINWNERKRLSAVARADRWTANQTRRLNTMSEVILEAIRESGWLPEQIEQISSRYRLEDCPPPFEGVHDRIDNRLDRERKAKAMAIAKDNTAMAIAFRKAKDRAGNVRAI